MRAALLTIGLILVLAGIKVITARPAPAKPDSQVAGSSMVADQEIEKKKSLFLGWACLAGGAVAIAAGVRYGGRLIPPRMKAEEQCGGPDVGWL
jgi:uncharacterized membrane protein